MRDPSAAGPLVHLEGDVVMPLLGAGTQFGFADDGNPRGAPERGVDYVAAALRAGFRMLDTARGYGTEAQVLAGIAAAGLARDDVFVVTKAWPGGDHDVGLASSRAAIAESAARLGGRVDLFLVHQPVAGWQDLWRALESARDEGLVRAIGVSNFARVHFEELATFARHRPAVDQIHLHPFVHAERRETIELCQRHGIRVMAYPRAPWRLGEGSAVDEIARECGRTRVQVMLRWAIERGFAVIPLSTDERHLAENAAVLGFTLSEAQVRRLDRMTDPSMRFCVDLVTDGEVRGWAFAGGGLARILVQAGDRVLGEAEHGAQRPDVQAAHPDVPEALASGFSFRFPIAGLAERPREILLVLEARNGERAEIGPLAVPR